VIESDEGRLGRLGRDGRLGILGVERGRDGRVGIFGTLGSEGVFNFMNLDMVEVLDCDEWKQCSEELSLSLNLPIDSRVFIIVSVVETYREKIGIMIRY
jgi:hypothetical protein